MDILFEGFNTAVPLWLIFTLIPAAFIFSWWTYSRNEGLQGIYRILLVMLRGAAISLLLFLLLNPAFILQQEYSNTGEIAVLWDNSASTTIEKGNYEGEASYNQIWDALDPLSTSEVRFNNYMFDTEVAELNEEDELTLDGTGTNIHTALTEVREELEDEHALLFISDGIYNTGRNPSALASRYPVPIYTVGIGDTTRLDDIIVQQVSHNSTAYINTRTAITATIVNDGFPDIEFPVQLRQDGEIIEEETVTTTSERSSHEIRFETDLEEEGLKQFDIHVPEVEGEWTTENNTQPFAIDVRDDRTRIMVMSFEIHPDVRTLRSILGTDESIMMDTRTWTGDENFSEGSMPDRPDTLDLVLFYGYPHPNLPAELRGDLQDFASDIPASFFSSPKMDFSRLSNDFAGIVPLDGSGNQFNNMQPYPSEEQSHPIVELPEIEFNRLPDLRVPDRFLDSRQGSQTLYTGSYRGADTGSPLLTVRTTGNIRSSQFTGYNFHRWFLSDNDDIRDYTIELINNIVKWTATSADDELLDISPATQIFEQNEDVILDAYLQNESGETEPDGVIDVEIEGDEIETSQYTMSNEGLGQYRLNIGRLPEGSYSYTAVAEKDGRELDEQTGEFSVGDTNLEFIDTERNDELLRYLADQSGGRFLTHEDSDQLRSILEEDGLFEDRIETSEDQILAYQNPLWFILVILLLTAEWIIRKLVALP